MGLSDAVIRRSYDSGNRSVNVVRDFLEPILSESITYDRLTGFFTSGMLAAAARGIGSFLSAGGKMRMVTSPQLSPRDIQAIDEIEELESRNAVFDACILRGLQGLSQLQSSIERDHVAAMAWMIKTGALEIRIAVPAPGRHDLNALFHHKVGIVRSSEGEQLSFSGSINETAAAWTSNFESFKVFREWVDAEREYFNDDVELFDTYWNADEDSLTRVIPLSEAVREQLLSIAPETLDEVLVKLQSSGSNKQNSESSQPIKFRDYQVAAIKAWKDAGYRGILAMATGTGKTKTAVGCFQELAKSEEKLVVVVTSPFQHISVQWAKEFAPWDGEKNSRNKSKNVNSAPKVSLSLALSKTPHRARSSFRKLSP